MKRILSIALCLLLACSALPAALAEEIARDDYTGRVIQILNAWDAQNQQAESGADQLANGAYRLTELLAVIAAEIDADGAMVDTADTVLAGMTESDGDCEDAAARARNGIHHATLLMALLSHACNGHDQDALDRIEELTVNAGPTPESFAGEYLYLADRLCDLVELSALMDAGLFQDASRSEATLAELRDLTGAESGDDLYRARRAAGLLVETLSRTAASLDMDDSSAEMISSILAQSDPEDAELDDAHLLVLNLYYSVETASILALELGQAADTPDTPS